MGINTGMVVTGAIGSTGITLTFPLMLNDLLGTKFKMVLGYTGSGALNIAIESGEVSARNNSWSSWKTSKPEWLSGKTISILVYSGPKPADIGDVPALEELVKTDEEREVVKVVTAGNGLGHPFATAPGVPEDRVAALRKAFADMLNDPEFRKEAEMSKNEIDPVNAAMLEKDQQPPLDYRDPPKRGTKE